MNSNWFTQYSFTSNLKYIKFLQYICQVAFANASYVEIAKEIADEVPHLDAADGQNVAEKEVVVGEELREVVQ